jgi:DNA modification methylase
MAFADPPDNIGLAYSGFKDKMKDFEYRDLLRNILLFSTNKCDVLWLSLNSRHAALAGHVIYETMNWREDWEIKVCVQTFTFYQHNHNDLGNAHRLLYRIMKKGTQLYPDAIRVPSWRQLNGDKRADPRGRVPGDVFDFPRVTGNSKQRRRFSPTQLHEGLYERCIRLCCKEGDTVVDLFAGSGTLGRVAGRCGVNAVMVELSKETCEKIAADQGIKRIC